LSAPFPLPLEVYPASADASLLDVLVQRVQQEPINAVATAIFLLAVVHTFFAPRILDYSKRLGPTFVGNVLHFFGEVEAVFGIWVLPLLLALTLLKGWPTVDAFMSHGVNFDEPLFVFVIMVIAATRPILALAEQVLGGLARLGGETPLAWWLSVLVAGPLLGSLITEPAAMTICALLLARQLYPLGPSPALCYGTLGLLFVNISVGGTLTHFAAPPVLMVAERWSWDTPFMLSHFGWKAGLAIALSSAAYTLFFRNEFRLLAERARGGGPGEGDGMSDPVPVWVTLVHLGFLAFAVFAVHTPALELGAFLFCIAFMQAADKHQNALQLRPAILVGFFLAGLVIHGALQQWWIEPVLARLSELPLMIGATVLTAFNDNAAITYLASLVPSFGEASRYAVVAGAIAGGGLTVIANAPNPAGQAILGRFFPSGSVHAGGLLLGAAVPTLIVGLCFWFL
jgi:hypothetical protein